MQTKNPFLKHPKNFSVFNHTMLPKRRSRNEDDDYTIPARETLPRRCKSIRPFYGIDIVLNQMINIQNNQPLGSSSSTQNSAQGLGPKHPRKKPINEVNHIQDVKPEIQQVNRNVHKEMNISNSILSWLVESKVLRENTRLVYRIGTGSNVLGQGKLTKKGILCSCCENMFSLSKFALHKGHKDDEIPTEHIFVRDTNVSLLTCQIEAWNRHSVPARNGYHHSERKPKVRDHYDDCCVICADGGRLICCEGCPSAYHLECIGIEVIPDNDWKCPYCRCRYCALDTGHDLLLTCSQCFKKYHQRCSMGADDSHNWEDRPLVMPFCGQSCWLVYQTLERALGRSVIIEPGLSWTLVRRQDLNIEHLAKITKCNTMVVLAEKLMQESFDPIVDRHTRNNMIQSVVYNCGSNFPRTNFSRFYTAVLENDGRVISAASLRIPSPEIAEIPFIATSEAWRRKGMCRKLLQAIESALGDIGIKRIVIPSSTEMLAKWQIKFGFVKVDYQTNKNIKELNTLMFPKTKRLQKVINPKTRKTADLNFLPPSSPAPTSGQ